MTRSDFNEQNTSSIASSENTSTEIFFYEVGIDLHFLRLLKLMSLDSFD
jgi:hypothetical protein